MCFAKVRAQSDHCNGPPERVNCGYCHLVEIGVHSLLTIADKVCRVTLWVLGFACLSTGHKLREINMSA